MARRSPLAAALCLVASVALASAWGCIQEPPPSGDDCEQARAVFTKCGVTLPLLTGGACTGMQRIVARCVARHATTCDELSTLLGRVDACAADELDGGDLPPVSDLPVPPAVDAGADAAHEGALPAVDPGSPDAGAASRDAAPARLDAAADARATD